MIALLEKLIKELFFTDFWPRQEKLRRKNYNEEEEAMRHLCTKCNRSYKHRSHMIRHFKYECGIPQRFECPYCQRHLRQRTDVWNHIRALHPNHEFYCIDIETKTKLIRKIPRNK